MNYIIFDLELNSKIFKSKLPNEIIEIGAIKLNEKLELQKEFQTFVRPKIHKKLFPIIKRKTGIEQKDINNSVAFSEAFREFSKWAGQDSILCCWGHDDIHHLRTNCKLNRINTQWHQAYIDIQKHFSIIYNSPAGSRYSLKKALALMEIPCEDKLHRARIDALYTSYIFKRIYTEISPDTLITLNSAKAPSPGRPSQEHQVIPAPSCATHSAHHHDLQGSQ